MPETAWNMLRASWMAMRYPAPSPQYEANAEEEPDELDEFQAYEEKKQREHQARNDLTRLIRLSLQGDRAARQELEEIMQHACVTHDMLYTSTLLSCIARLSQLEDMLIQEGKRRDQLMRMIEDRRRTNAVMTRSLLRQDTRASAMDVRQEDEGGASE